MEFGGLHLQHQFQKEYSDQCNMTTSAGSGSATPSTSTSQSWNILSNSNIYNGYSHTHGFLTNSRSEVGHNYKYAMNMIDSLRISTGQANNIGFHNEENYLTDQQPPCSNDILLPPKLSEIMNFSTKALDESREPQCSPSFLSSRLVNGTHHFPTAHKPTEGMMMALNFGSVSSISSLPTPDHMNSLAFNSQMLLDLHTSYYSYDTFGLNEESVSLCHGNMHGPSNSSNKISSLVSEVTMMKRPSNCSRLKGCEGKAKKSRPSCPPLKVRKEKLGDRIQTLQRLVAPFGKTSTACVLNEAIGYIHFLHEHIQTLSIPYMKSAQSKPRRMVQLDSKKLDSSKEFKPDLRSRGLCLVPVSYASFIHRCV